MKEKTVNKQFQVYTCDVCGKESATKGEIEHCEKNHGCPHDVVRTKIYYEYDGMFLLQECATCHATLGPWINLTSLPEAKRKKLYNFVKELIKEKK
jgi:hypothetical protein